MSGTSLSKFTASGTVPNQESLGAYHRFDFGDTNPQVKLQAFSLFAPTPQNDSSINIESRNFNYAGFRWRHLTKSTDSNLFGSFSLQSFISDGAGIDIFGFKGGNFNIYFPVFLTNNLDMGTSKITNLATPVAGTDAANRNYVDGKVSAGTIVLTGNVTGSGTIGTSFATTLALRLDQIIAPAAAVNLNNQKITNLATPTLTTDATNKAYVDGKTVVLTGDVTGSGTVGVSFTTNLALTLNQIDAPTAAVSLNSQKITNLATPVAGTDGANKSYVDSTLASSTIVLTGNVTGSGVLGTPFATTIVSTLNNIPVATGPINLNSQNITNAGNVGIGVSSPTTPLQFAATTADCKICLYQSVGGNNFQLYGFGVTSGTLKYTVDNPASSHVFYCGASSTSSTELFRIKGAGWASVSGGDGTFYSRVPSAHISLVTGSSTTTPAGTWTKLNATTTASTGMVQFTASSNRITFTGSDLGVSCVGMISASAILTMTGVTTVNIAIFKNGTVAATPSVAYATNTAASTPFSISTPDTMITLSPGDYLEVWAQSTGVTITTQYLNLSFVAC